MQIVRPQPNVRNKEFWGWDPTILIVTNSPVVLLLTKFETHGFGRKSR